MPLCIYTVYIYEAIINTPTSWTGLWWINNKNVRTGPLFGMVCIVIMMNIYIAAAHLSQQCQKRSRNFLIKVTLYTRQYDWENVFFFCSLLFARDILQVLIRSMKIRCGLKYRCRCCCYCYFWYMYTMPWYHHAIETIFLARSLSNELFKLFNWIHRTQQICEQFSVYLSWLRLNELAPRPAHSWPPSNVNELSLSIH